MKMNRILGLMAVASALASAQSTTADRVYGQNGSFTTNGTGTTATTMNYPNDIALDSGGGVFVVECGNNRVLHFPSGSTTPDQVYGQGGSYTTSAAGLSATGLSCPTGIGIDTSGGIYVADRNNNRVLHFPLGSTTADRVYGQGGSFTSNSSGTSATAINHPSAVKVDSGGGIYVADLGNTRVLHFPSGSTTADVVYGQGGSFVTSNFGTSSTTLNFPWGLQIDPSGGIYIADEDNNRVLHFPTSSTTAERVYGQGGSFTTANSGVSSTLLSEPTGAVVDSSGGVFIADYNNSRVLHFPSGSTTADRVYGQGGSFTANATATGSTGMNFPEAVALDSGGLYVVDSGNNRVLHFPATASVSAAPIPNSMLLMLLGLAAMAFFFTSRKLRQQN